MKFCNMKKNRKVIFIFIGILIFSLLAGLSVKIFYKSAEENIEKLDLVNLPIYENKESSYVDEPDSKLSEQVVNEKEIKCEREKDLFRCELMDWGFSFLSPKEIGDYADIVDGENHIAYLLFDENIIFSMFEKISSDEKLSEKDLLNSVGFWNVREDIFEKTKYKISKLPTYLSKNEKGWCDGPSCSAPYLVYGILKNGRFYQVTFFGDTVFDPNEDRLLQSIQIK